jgi:hypothetical protein
MRDRIAAMTADDRARVGAALLALYDEDDVDTAVGPEDVPDDLSPEEEAGVTRIVRYAEALIGRHAAETALAAQTARADREAAARESAQVLIDLQWGRAQAAERERDEALANIDAVREAGERRARSLRTSADLWRERAESEAAARQAAERGRDEARARLEIDPGGSDRIDALEYSLSMCIEERSHARADFASALNDALQAGKIANAERSRARALAAQVEGLRGGIVEARRLLRIADGAATKARRVAFLRQTDGALDVALGAALAAPAPAPAGGPALPAACPPACPVRAAAEDLCDVEHDRHEAAARKSRAMGEHAAALLWEERALVAARLADNIRALAQPAPERAEGGSDATDL